ncbi:1-phosphofructokinase [Pseudomonas sp. ZM23]|uniref:Phosphofructokinase n=1 Tax=Pseudomonas triclosanedens TaxID=2961893 RepID=A0ABY7A271_9PSED|nr:1-phosphofructokinase [Pseudomonas triclosanedens]MCP8463828.1 1-phosphofructokinase [Pseudomonas triclosanedens]MCP8468912.1 1-phosphofructokinase [Pseudomonas triclosanedens]MCP8475634.1 1-phosphofructokinase [Pseudomonas triclosanedens]WAI50651.1 1-phosphofructokinase [Pseudomonas triclosanedens]
MARILTVTLNPALDLTVRLPHLDVGEVNRSESVLVQAAGKGLNVAQVLADLGHHLTVTGFLGADNAPPFDALFRRRGFVDAFVRVPGETRSNIKLAEVTGRITDINGPGPLVSGAQQDALLDRLDLISADFEVAVVAGSLPRGIEPQWLCELLQRLKSRGLKVAFDCSGAALRAGIEAGPWLIKPNDQELGEACGQLAGSDAETAAQVESLRARGIEQVVLSQGADGVRWFGPQGTWQALPPAVDVASTVGAGDSLLAGMLHGLLCGWPAERVLRHATAVAALAVTQFDFGIGDAQRLSRIEDGVQVRALA